MKVYVFPADIHGCGCYRLIWPARALRRAGHDITIVMPQNRAAMFRGVMRGDIMVDVQLPADADVVVFQRVTNRHVTQAVEVLRRKNIAVVIDMDDDLTCIHPANPAFTMLHPRGPNAEHSWRNTTQSCAAATLVTVSTPALLEVYAPHGRGQVLYNMVPRRMLELDHVDSDVIGWGGSVHSHPTDLQVMGPAIAQLLQSGGRFRVAGNITGIHQALGVSSKVEIEATGAVDIEAWPLALATLGIGVAPLADSKFNRSKSWLKMAEYAALGIPTVASPRVEYTRLHKLGVGWLANHPNEWRTKLRQLTQSAELRRELGEKSRSVMRDYTIEENAWRWWETWSRALTIQRDNPLGLT